MWSFHQTQFFGSQSVVKLMGMSCKSKFYKMIKQAKTSTHELLQKKKYIKTELISNAQKFFPTLNGELFCFHSDATIQQ